MTAFLVASMVSTLVLLALGGWLLMRAKPSFEGQPAPAVLPPPA